jgi:hypothetical protein
MPQSAFSRRCFRTGAAQDFTGTYSVQDQAGARMTVALSQDAQGQVTGTLTGGSAPLTLQGKVVHGLLTGTISGPASSGFIEARLRDSVLVLTLIEADANHKPDRSRTGQIELTREHPTPDSGSAPAHPPSRPAGGPRPGPTASFQEKAPRQPQEEQESAHIGEGGHKDR